MKESDLAMKIRKDSCGNDRISNLRFIFVSTAPWYVHEAIFHLTHSFDELVMIVSHLHIPSPAGTNLPVGVCLRSILTDSCEDILHH